MENLKEKLIKEAVQKYGRIKKIVTGKEFTIEGKQLWYWFNDIEDSTHVVACEI
jgi:hypothetical protein